MGDELVELDEAAVIEEGGDAFARRQLAGLVLLGDARFAARDRGLRLHVFETGDWILMFHAAYSSGVANVKGSALVSRVLWVELGHGSRGLERLLAQCSLELRGSIEGGLRKAAWYPFDQFIELNLVIDRLWGHGDLELVKTLGRYGADANLTTIYRLFYKVGTVHWILGRAVRLWSAHYDSGYLEVMTRGARGAVGRIRGFATPHEVHCRSVAGWCERCIELSGGGRAEVVETRCRTRGDELCQLEMKWE
jgi:hypothetical protein